MTALYKYRKEKGMTQKELAEAMEIIPVAITQYESGARKPDIAKLKNWRQYSAARQIIFWNLLKFKET